MKEEMKGRTKEVQDRTKLTKMAVVKSLSINNYLKV